MFLNKKPNIHIYHAVDDTQALEVVLEVAASWHLGVQILGSHPAWPLEAVRVEYKRHSGYLLVPEESEIQAARPFAAVLVVVVDMDLEKMLESQKAWENSEKHQDLCKNIPVIYQMIWKW